MRDRQHLRFCTSSDGTRLAYASVGSGPPLVKAANWLSHLEYEWSSPIWRHWIEGLSRHRTYIRYDERGCGLSDREPAEMSFESWVRDLEAVVDACGLERFPLLGLSQGAAIALEYTARHPERVSHLILDDTQARTEDFFNVPQMRALDQLTTDWDAFLEYLAFMIYGVGREAARPVVEFFRAGVTQEKATLISAGARQDDVNELLPAST